MAVKNICTNMVCTAYGQGTPRVQHTHAARGYYIRRTCDTRTPYMQSTYAVREKRLRRKQNSFTAQSF